MQSLLILKAKAMTIEGKSKINLALNIEGTLPNGYHSIKTVFQQVSLSDEISMEFGRDGVNLTCSQAKIPSDEKNIAYRAAVSFYEATGISDGVAIHIEKRIPSEAGLAGGSADAAAVLKGMNDYYGKPLSDDRLIQLGLTLGADVPFCILGGTALAEGVGEILTPIESKIKEKVLIVKPKVGVSTPWAYKELDKKGFTPVDVQKVIASLKNGDFLSLCQSMGNVFEQVVLPEFGEVKAVKEKLFDLGAMGAMMSGSGTAVFAFFKNQNAMENAFNHFKENGLDVFITEMI